MPSNVENAVNHLKALGIESLAGAISTGSGQSLPLEGITEQLICGYDEVPGLEDSTISGHEGVLRVVTGAEGLWAIWTGRRHFYQGFDYHEIGSYIEISKKLGATNLLCVNAAGGLDPALSVGDLIVIERYRNFIPFREKAVPYDGEQWVATSSELLSRLMDAASRCGIRIRKGSYVGVPGPTYETAAEVEWLRRLGCEVIGMSTVPELAKGKELGMESIALSLVANVHGMGSDVTHSEVVRSSEAGAAELERLVSAFLKGRAGTV